MSESVEKHMESMTEEIEEMRRIKLFSVEETRAILKKRKHYEYKINGVSKNLQDFKNYIQYEKILLRDIKVRRNKYRVADRKNSIEFKILKRIKYLYEIALQRFSNDFALCLSYFKFCKEFNYNRPASLVIQNMIKNFSHNPEVWQVAAAWYIKTDLNQALNVIHKGLMIHKNCQLLYREAIQLELLNREKDEWAKDVKLPKSKDELCCDKINTYIQSIFKNILDYNFLLEILKILEQHNFTSGVQNTIIARLLECYCDEELVWHTLAQREKNGFHFGVVDEAILKSTKFCLNRSFQKYEEGLSKISEQKKAALWTLYLDFLIELQQENDVAAIIKKNKLLSALEAASKQIPLEEKYFIVWAKLTNNEAETVKVIEKGLATAPSSIELWKLRLRCAIIKDHVKDVNQIFNRGQLQLKEKSAPLWIMTLRYHTLTSGNEVLELIYKGGIEQPKEISDIFKPEYIEWLALCKGIRNARKAYNLLAQQKPYCKELHNAMFKIESLEMDQDVDEMENVLKLAWEQFGSEDIEVSINYIQFYLQNHKTFEDKNPSFDVNDKILDIYRKTVSRLEQCNDPLLLSNFKEKYDSVRNSTDI
ncbi:U3 small nucleolar RNA-associated protein 6 homolog [Anoplophora glabripennis]|nr:U3 small nucleolar RNA-associated protein 6 homolog [Anoplophora glabripennis]